MRIGVFIYHAGAIWTALSLCPAHAIDVVTVGNAGNGAASTGYGRVDYSYQTGTDSIPGRDLVDISGNNANSYGSPIPIDEGKYTTLVGQFQNSVSPYGTFDPGGNVWEWTETLSGPWGYARGGGLGIGVLGFSRLRKRSSKPVNCPRFNVALAG